MISALVGVMLAGMQMLAGWRLQAAPLVYWSLATLALTGACLFFAVRGDIGLAPSVLVGNGLLLVGMGLVFSGIRAFDRQPPRLGAVAGIAAAGIVALAVSLSFGDNAPNRVTIVSVLVATWAATSGAALLERSGSGPLLSRFASAMILFAVAAAFTARGVGAQFGYITAAGPLNSPAELAVAVASLVLVIAWSFGSLFMVLERLASVDDLTGLFNRRATLQQARELLNAAKARRQPLSVLLADLDHFKSVNDRFGHEVGDIVLQHIAFVMRATVRSCDVVGRHGGEEFCIVLPGTAEREALAVAERLRMLAQEELTRVDGFDTGVTLTVGMASFAPERPGLHEIKELIAASDAALYRAKAQGRNRVACAGQLPLESGASAAMGKGQIAARPSA